MALRSHEVMAACAVEIYTRKPMPRWVRVALWFVTFSGLGVLMALGI